MKDKFEIGDLVVLVHDQGVTWEVIANKSQPYTDDFPEPQTKQYNVPHGVDYLLKMTRASQLKKNGPDSISIEPYRAAIERELHAGGVIL